MPRPRAADYQERRAAILGKATYLYARRGYVGASLKDLAEACNSSHATIYHYFSSKEDILHAAMETHLNGLSRQAMLVVRSKKSAPEKLRRLARAFTRLSMRNADEHKVLVNEIMHLSSERREKIAARQKAITDAVGAVLCEVHPDLRARQLGDASAMLFFGMINWMHTWFDPIGELSDQRMADLIADLMLGRQFGSPIRKAKIS